MSQDSLQNQQNQAVNTISQETEKVKAISGRSIVDDTKEDPKKKKPQEQLDETEQQNNAQAAKDDLGLMGILQKMVEWLLGKEKEKEEAKGKDAQQSIQPKSPEKGVNIEQIAGMGQDVGVSTGTYSPLSGMKIGSSSSMGTPNINAAASVVGKSGGMGV